MSDSRAVEGTDSRSRALLDPSLGAATESIVDRTQSPSESVGRTGLVGGTQRISSLAGSLTALSSLMSRHRQLESVAVDDLVREVWGELSTGDGRLELETSRPVVADREWLTLALRELLSNAVEHGGPAATVRVGVEDGIYVADDGPGIPAGRREDAVRSGYSADGSSAGFGLTVVDQVAASHEWTLTLEESSTGGTRATLRFDR